MAGAPQVPDRYSRQVVMRELGEAGQLRLGSVRVEVRGSTPAALVAATYLAVGGTPVELIDRPVTGTDAGFAVAAGDVGNSLAAAFRAAIADLNPDLMTAEVGDDRPAIVSDHLAAWTDRARFEDAPAVALGGRGTSAVVLFKPAGACPDCFRLNATALESSTAFAAQVLLGATAALAMQRLLWGAHRRLGEIELLAEGTSREGEIAPLPGVRMKGPARIPVAPVASAADLVGRTPLLKIQKIGRELEGVEIYAKLEFFNPGGSVKDRAARQIFLEAIESGRLTPGKTLIDSTSGNTGVAYSWLGAALGYKVALVMPSNVSVARKQITRAYGAELIYSDPMEGSDGAIRHVRSLVEQFPDRYFYPDQYSNEANPRAHWLTTAPEIWEQTSGKVTHFCCGIGTGGTVMGTGRRLKQYRPEIRVIALEPLEPMHGLEGLKHMPTSIVPAIYREQELDEKLSIATDEGWDMTDRLLKEEGLLVGHSAGAAMVGALQVARRIHGAGQQGTVVTLFPDRADRYFEPMRWPRTFSW